MKEENIIKKSNNFVLKLNNISKEFPGVKALKGVNFVLRRGEVHALVGENGAGKSTLMKILIGVYTKDSGEIIIDGKETNIKDPKTAHEHGIGMIFQELSLVPQLTVAQNIFLNIEYRRKIPFFINDKMIYKKSLELMDKYNIQINPEEYVHNLSRGFSQIVEVLKVLAQNVRIMIMDEPTSSLTKTEEETLYGIIKNLKKRGVSIIYISHRLQEIFDTCDRVTVLRDGLKVDTRNVSDISMGKLVELMTGRVMEKSKFTEISEWEKIKKENILEVKDLTIKPRVNVVNFAVKRGEILGITGLMGSGKSEIARVLFGIDFMDKGEVYMDGRKLNIKNPGDAINIGIFLVPEDRRREGLILNQTVESNLTLPILHLISKGWFVNSRKSERKTNEQIESLSIRTPSIRQLTAYLSGGNQQKVVIGKWLMENPKILILDEPTVGVDVNTKVELRNIISNLTSKHQCSVVLFSSELNEIIKLSSRILVLYKGTIFKEFLNYPPIEETILHHAVQGID